MQNRLQFQKGDLLAIGLVLLLAVLVFVLFLPGKENSGSRVELYRDGELVASYLLTEPREVLLEGEYTNVITIRDGRAAITSSDCPGEDCVASGWIDQAGRSIVCLPNGVEVRIVGGPGDGVDFVVG